MNTTSNKRLLALDVMRGITIAGMILVNIIRALGDMHTLP